MSKKRLIQAAFFLTLLLGFAVMLVIAKEIDSEQLLSFLNQHFQPDSLITISLFAVFYCFSSMVFFPATLVTLAAGAFFGPWLGAAYSLIGATMGATLSFLIARYFSHHWIEHKAGSQLEKLQAGVANEGWRFVAFVRLVPLFPFSLLNYALGLTQVRLSHYILATLIFMIPGGVAYAYLGHLGHAAVTGDAELIKKSLIALSLFACLLYLPRLAKLIRRQRAEN